MQSKPPKPFEQQITNFMLLLFLFLQTSFEPVDVFVTQGGGRDYLNVVTPLEQMPDNFVRAGGLRSYCFPLCKIKNRKEYLQSENSFLSGYNAQKSFTKRLVAQFSVTKIPLFI